MSQTTFDIDAWLDNHHVGSYLKPWAKKEIRTLFENIHHMGDVVTDISILHFTEFSEVKFEVNGDTWDYQIKEGRNAVLL